MNPVKKELGWSLAGGFLLWLLVARLVPSSAGQVGVLALYGFLAALWLVFRTRQVLRRTEMESKEAGRVENGEK